jgi:hypothetical protein
MLNINATYCGTASFISCISIQIVNDSSIYKALEMHPRSNTAITSSEFHTLE